MALKQSYNKASHECSMNLASVKGSHQFRLFGFSRNPGKRRTYNLGYLHWVLREIVLDTYLGVCCYKNHGFILHTWLGARDSQIEISDEKLLTKASYCGARTLALDQTLVSVRRVLLEKIAS